MDCHDAQFMLRIRGWGNNEGCPEEFKALDSHLLSCRDCATLAERILSQDRALARAMVAVNVPPGLEVQIREGIRNTQRRKKQLRLALGLAWAASFLLILGLIWGISSASRPSLQLDALALGEDFRLDNPDAAAREWLHQQHLPERLPLAFNMALCITQGHRTVQGRRVPYLLFHDTRGSSMQRIAYVLFFRDGEFRNLRELQPVMSSYFQSRIFHDVDGHRGLTMVVLFTGQTDDDLKPFLLLNQQT